MVGDSAIYFWIQGQQNGERAEKPHGGGGWADRERARLTVMFLVVSSVGGRDLVELVAEHPLEELALEAPDVEARVPNQALY